MSEPTYPAEYNPAGVEYPTQPVAAAYTEPASPAQPAAIPAPAQPVQSPYTAPVQPPYATPVQSPYASPVQPPYSAPAPAPYASPAAPTYPPATGYPSAYDGTPASAAPTSAVPTSAMPTSVMPTSVMPMSAPTAYTPGYGQPGYAQPGFAQPGYPQAPYPTAGFPAPAPKKKGRAATIVFAILAVLFLFSSIGSGLLYASTNKDLTSARQAQSASDKANAANVADLKQQIAGATAKAEAAQVANQHLTEILRDQKACVAQAEVLIDMPTSASNAAFHAAYEKFVTLCDTATHDNG